MGLPYPSLCSRIIEVRRDAKSTGDRRESSWTMLTPRSGTPVLLYAVSGLGKSQLAAAHPSVVRDADQFLYAALASGFPDLAPRERLRAWRALCRRLPWKQGGEPLRRWATIRRAWVVPFVAAMRDGGHPLVVTSLLHPPWIVSAYYGLERGHYAEHLRRAGRRADNHQAETMNDRLDGYYPLVRMPAGTFLGERAEVRAIVDCAALAPGRQ